MNRTLLFHRFPAVISSFSLAACSPGSSYVLAPNPTPYYETSPSEYYLYLPSSCTPDKDWPVLVGAHGYGSETLRSRHRFVYGAEEHSPSAQRGAPAR